MKNTWVFVTNPKKYDIYSDWEKSITETAWSVLTVRGATKDALDSALEDRVYIWVSGEGVAARAVITGPAGAASGGKAGWDSEAAAKLPSDLKKVPMRIERWLPRDQPITIESLKDDDATKHLKICANGGLQATNLLQDAADAKALDAAWDRHIASIPN